MSVFILYSADSNLSYDSYTLEAVCDSKKMAIKLITPTLKKEAKKEYKHVTYSDPKEMLSDLLSNLNEIGQTQTLSTNYVIREHLLNTFDCL